MINVERREIRTDNRSRNIAAFDIAPRLRIAVDATMTPTDHRVGAVKITIAQMLGTNKVAEVFARCGHRYDQADMHAVGFDENVDTFLRFPPVAVRRNMAADERSCHENPDNKQRPPDQGTQRRRQAVDTKQFQV